jgi:hypothetical protein
LIQTFTGQRSHISIHLYCPSIGPINHCIDKA